MSQPPEYKFQADFTKNHGSVQNDALLNAEFRNIEQAINNKEKNGLRDRMALLLKDDDTLKNDIVGYDNLTPLLKSQFEDYDAQVAGATAVSLQAKADAENALAIANDAKSIVDDANDKSDEALLTANEAKTTADNADSKADTAIRTANEANETAVAASESASTSLETANTASTTAQDAVTQVQNAINETIPATVSQAITDADIESQVRYWVEQLDPSSVTINDNEPLPNSVYSSQKTQSIVDAEEQARQALDESLATVAKSGSYADLTNKPTIPTVPANVSAFTNDADYLTPNSTLNASKLNVSYLPTAGGTVTGTITSSVTNTLRRNVDNSFLNIFGGSTYQKGAWIALHGIDSQSSGQFQISARDSTTNYSLTGSPNGSLKWVGNEVLTTTNGLPLSGGTMTGQITSNVDAIIRRYGTSDALTLYGSNSWSNGAALGLYGKDHATKAGRFDLTARSASGYVMLEGLGDGTLRWDRKNILREDTLCSTKPTATSTASASNPAVVVENYYDAGDWYRVFSDGWVEQGGVSYDATATQQSIELHYALGNTTTEYQVMITPIGTSNADFRPLVVLNGINSFTVYNYSKKAFYWEVKGFKG